MIKVIQCNGRSNRSKEWLTQKKGTRLTQCRTWPLVTDDILLTTLRMQDTLGTTFFQKCQVIKQNLQKFTTIKRLVQARIYGKIKFRQK